MHNKRSVFQRIHSVKTSLENAEQSFLDNNGVRGELDLMLAEKLLTKNRISSICYLGNSEGWVNVELKQVKI